LALRKDFTESMQLGMDLILKCNYVASVKCNYVVLWLPSPAQPN
jgi:hypothetical protein